MWLDLAARLLAEKQIALLRQINSVEDYPEPDPSIVSGAAPDAVLHLGSYVRESWSVQRLARAVAPREISVMEAYLAGIGGRRMFCWHPNFWRAVPPERRKGASAFLFFHHELEERFDEGDVVAAAAVNQEMAGRLRARNSGKRVFVIPPGGAEDALPYARRRHRTTRIRLLMSGNAAATMKGAESRKGTDLILPLAKRLDPDRYEWVLIGFQWEQHAAVLREHGFIVLQPGALPEPEHFTWYGEGDILLMLSRLEGGPLPLHEAMGVGLWPISMRTGFAPEIIEHGVNGHLLPDRYGDDVGEAADAVAAAIESLHHERLCAAAPLVRASVAGRTWSNFRRGVLAAIDEVYG
jgi:glycosyltransferase involved in cell wall biosynthesis